MKEQRRRVIFLNRFFYPDHAPTAELLSDVAFVLAERGLTSASSPADRVTRRPTPSFRLESASEASTSPGCGLQNAADCDFKVGASIT